MRKHLQTARRQRNRHKATLSNPADTVMGSVDAVSLVVDFIEGIINLAT